MSNFVQRYELFLKLKYFRVIIFNGYFPFSMKYCVYAAAISHGIGIQTIPRLQLCQAPDWIKRKIGLQKRLDLDYLTLESKLLKTL